MTFEEKINRFNKKLAYTGAALPAGIRIINPFREPGEASKASEAFYKKYYSDDKQRHLILGINPGRFGAGLTGIPFTDPKRLVNECNIAYDGNAAHEPSSAFIYEMIHAYGGAKLFYQHFYINSLCPLGFTSVAENGKEKNYNYYDSKELSAVVHDFIIENIRKQIRIGVDTDVCFCFGTGKNEQYLNKINKEYRFFKKIIALEHPRFIMQYKNAHKQFYIDKYISAFKSVR
jgi:hypothetical protein